MLEGVERAERGARTRVGERRRGIGRAHAWTLAALWAAAAGAPALAAPGARTGEQVYGEVCSACHAEGLNKAPKFGDRKAWGPLIREGPPMLIGHAWVGVRGMPPRGGREDLSLAEFARGAVHMARAAGANWTDPDAAMLARIEAEARRRGARAAKGR
jgi:cytochrome c5